MVLPYCLGSTSQYPQNLQEPATEDVDIFTQRKRRNENSTYSNSENSRTSSVSLSSYSQRVRLQPARGISRTSSVNGLYPRSSSVLSLESNQGVFSTSSGELRAASIVSQPRSSGVLPVGRSGSLKHLIISDEADTDRDSFTKRRSCASLTTEDDGDQVVRDHCSATAADAFPSSFASPWCIPVYSGVTMPGAHAQSAHPSVDQPLSPELMVID
ncbi:hypothetical protein BJ742DRAFT_805540 [Cladochytrium replicatum]|nr:hypothetical protein BJ742DRAFT_805540 [Cladochytrium replicatum]